VGQSMRDRSEVCPLPPGPLKDLTLYSRPNPILVAVSLTFILMTSGLVYYLMLPPPYTPPPPPPPPHAVIAIDGDANFSDTALLEGWPGDGSPENPFIIDGLDIVVDGGHLISISNTRVSFTISNCNLTGACVNTMYGTDGTGIYLNNVTNGELVNNICNSNWHGISLGESDHNTVVNNTCINNRGICIPPSWYGVVTPHPGGNDIGISLEESDSNFVVDNICNNNEIGIYLDDESEFNTVENNTFSGNTEQDIVDEWLAHREEKELAHREYVGKQLVWFLAGCGMILVVSVIVVVQFRRMEI